MAARAAGRRFGSGHLRLALLGVGLVLAWTGMGYRLFQVQVVQADMLREEAIEGRLTRRQIAPQRGNIYDRNGDPLAMTVEAESLFVIPAELTEPVYVAQQVGSLLGRDPDHLLAEITAGSGFVYLKRQVELDLAQQVKSLELPGVYSHREAKRVYPTGSVASHAIGFVNIDGVGSEGIEFAFDQVLRGEPGEVLYERDPGGTPIPWAQSHTTPAIPGLDLHTTIDLSIQFAGLQACQSMVELAEAAGCWVVVMDIETGAVLAMVGAPEFDPVSRQAVDGSAFANFVVRGTYEPGSTMKLVSFAAGLEEQIIKPDTWIGGVADRIELTPQACDSRDDDIFGCYADFENHPTEDMTAQEVFTVSSNVGTIRIAQRYPAGVIGTYLQQFGFGSPTGISYSGEAGGFINLAAGCQICPLSAAIGYGVAVTPLQMAAAYAAIGNDGVWVEPHLIDAQSSVDGRPQPESHESRRIVSEETAWVLRHLLAQVVAEGTGGRAEVPGYQVGGKTGTADKLGEDGRYTDITMASFVGIAPITDPKVVVAVVVDSPSFEYRTGGRAAAPVFAEVMEHALHRLGVTPDASSG